MLHRIRLNNIYSYLYITPFPIFPSLPTYRPDEIQNSFSIASLTGVLQKAANKRRFIREEKSLEKMEKFERKSTIEPEKGEGSRSESQTSQAPSQLPVQAQSSTVVGKCLN